MRVKCERAAAGTHDELTTSDAFVGVVMLQLLPLSGLVADYAEDDEEFRGRVLDAAGDMKSAAELGLTTSLAGDSHAATAIQASQSIYDLSRHD